MSTQVNGTARPGMDGRSVASTLLDLAERFALLLLMLAFAVFFSLYGETRDTFPTLDNLQIILGNQSVLAVMTLGALLPLIAGEYDLSIGATLGLSSIVAAALIGHGVNPWLACGGAVLSGTLVGFINGFISTRMRVNSLITTLGASIILHGIVDGFTGGRSLTPPLPAALTALGTGDVAGIPTPVFSLAAVIFLVTYLLIYTPFGRYLYALGSNISAAKLVGLDTDRLLLSSFVLSGTLAGFSGVLQLAHAGSANPRVGEGFTLAALAAAFLSAASVTTGRYNVGGALIAVFFLAVLNSGLNLAGADVFLNQIVNGVALIGGVAIASYLGRRRAR